LSQKPTDWSSPGSMAGERRQEREEGEAESASFFPLVRSGCFHYRVLSFDLRVQPFLL
jgi:hypothetical protein